MVPQWSMSMTALATFAWKTRIFLKDRTKSSCFQMQVLQVLFQSVKGVWKICLKGIWKSVCFLGFSWIQKHQKLFLLFFKFSLSDILVSKFILCCYISFLQINPSASLALLLTPRKPLLSKKIHSPLLPSTERRHQDSLPWWRWGAEGVPSPRAAPSLRCLSSRHSTAAAWSSSQTLCGTAGAQHGEHPSMERSTYKTRLRNRGCRSFPFQSSLRD